MCDASILYLSITRQGSALSLNSLFFVTFTLPVFPMYWVDRRVCLQCQREVEEQQGQVHYSRGCAGRGDSWLTSVTPELSPQLSEGSSS